MKRLLAALPVFALLSCAHADKGAIYTENGIEAAERTWDQHYRSEAERCESLHEPETPEMEQCFGETYDIDAAIGKAVKSIVALLRAYWTARAAGEKPDVTELMKNIQQIIDDLPPEAHEYFAKVKGI